MPDKYRINKYIALCKGCSRRDAEKFVNDGHVKINGQKCIDLSVRVKTSDKVEISGELLRKPKFVYAIFNKPAGYITSREDEKGRKIIYDILPEQLHGLKSVGRLDKESSGLILLTNDGDLINLLTHPKYHIPKRYKVNVKGKFTVPNAESFAAGLDIGEKQLASADVLGMEKNKLGQTELMLVLYQGYNRQIRRMVEKVGAEVVSLKRMTIGPLSLKNLKRSEYTYLTQKEVNNLLKYIEKKAHKGLDEQELNDNE